MRVVQLPRVFNETAVHKFTRNIVSQHGTPLSSAIELVFSELDFIDGTGFTILCNTIEWLRFNDCRISFSGFRMENKKGISYLDSCGFFERYINQKIDSNNVQRETTVPCISITHAEAHGWIHKRLSPWLEWTMGLSGDQLSSIRTCVKELFNNIADHSECNTGFVHAQHYPNLRTIRITVSDFGRGIPYTIKRAFGPMRDQQAIQLATQEGVTSKSRPTNMGAGLNYLIDTVLHNEGRVGIHSLAGGVNCVRENGRQKRTPFAGNGIYPGTLVDITLDTRLFVGDDIERGEVEWN